MKKILCIILIFMMMLTSGCIEKKVKPTTSRKYLVYNLGELPRDLLMLNSDNIREKDLLLVLFEGLVKEDKYGQIVPAMAEKFDISEDKLQYTFKLRKDLHYSDGAVIKAIDFKRFFFNILSEKDNIFSEQLNCIFGALNFRMGKVSSDKVAISAEDDLTLIIRLNSPNDYFINILSNPVFSLRETNMDMKNWKDNYGAIQYSGPFIIKGINKDGEISLLKNEKYWRANEVKSSEMLFTSIKDEEKALADFETTENSDTSKIDVFVSPPISEVISLSMENKTEVIPSQSMYYLTFNLKTTNPIDVNYRKAISTIIDRQLIIQTISKDLAVPTMNYTPTSGGNDNNSKLTFDALGNKDKGLNYLIKSNYEEKPKLVMVFENQNFDSKISKEIAKSIKEYLNVNVVCKSYKKDELKDVLIKGDYDIVFSKIDEEYGDIYKFFSRWIEISKYNIFGYKNSHYDEIIGKALQEKDNKSKVAIYNEAQEILANDLPCIPVYIANTVICKKENIKDIYTTKSGNLVFDYAYKEDINVSK